ncbi:hypothetical protein MMC25_004986 [Agyrium rufum]|nr:hypothetical protein [Agyrium rufum]
MPESWVRASMLVRLNSIASGVSGVRVCTIETLMKLLAHNITPQIPIRGSISASGDLSPLSYIGGVMQGKPTIMAYAGQRSSGKRRVVRADVALAEAEITPIKLAAKEGLAIVNGTAVSAGVAALALHEAHCQAILAQILTAMSVEGLAGTDESFDPFFAKVRPHMGQRESAFNIQSFLVGSKLVYRNNGLEEASLRQDRYSIRTASQWIGPILEDFQLAHQQVTTELNSVTDNPLLDGERMLHGGNFQAASVRSAMEKVRQGCESLGRMLSVQCTELINPATNRGLPPNLVVDEPSESFIWKGSDIMVAALQSELGFLANPVGSHVQSAEMGNQALNSLALISARYTLDALAVLTQLSSVHLIALCQALDLRVMNTQYLAGLQKTFIDETRQAYVGLDQDTRWLDQCETELWKAFETLFSQTMGRDSTTRFQFVMRSLQPIVLKSAPPTTETVMAIHAWTQRCSEVALEQYILHRGSYVNHPDATGHIGPAAGRLYNFVRKHLRIPFLQEDGMRTPEPELLEPSTGPSKDGLPDMNTNGGTEKTTMNAIMAKVYQSMRSGELYVAVMETLQDAIHHHNGYKA